MDDLKTFLDTNLGWIFKTGLAVVIVASLFLFANLTTEFYDTPKFLVLFIFTALFLTLTVLRFTILNKVVLIRTPLDIPLLLLVTVAVVSTILSPAPYVALLGNQLKIHGSLVSLIILVLFYFTLINNLKGVKTIKWMLNIAIYTSVALSVVSLLAFAGIKLLPSPWAHNINFTPTGSTFTTTAVLALLIPVVTSQILSSTNLLTQVLNSVFLAIFGITIALTGTFSTWIAASLAFILTVAVNLKFDYKRLNQIKPVSLIALAIPLTAVILVVILSLIPPIGGAKNPLYTQYKSFPQEVQIPFVSAWKISISAFRDMPFWGTGPSSFTFDFTNYKPIEYNQTKLWNVRFDSSFNEYLQVLATLGGVGLLALVSLTALFIAHAGKVLMKHTDENYFSKTLAISGLTFFLILLLHAGTLVVWIIGLLILASFMVVNLSESSKTYGASNISQVISNIVNLSTANSSVQTIKIEALPSILLTVTVGLVLFSFYFGGKFTLADYHHRLALNAVAQNNGILAYNELIAAEKLNGVNDLYRTDLAQVNFALASAIASAKAPTESSPAGTLTDQDKQNISVLLQQSINEGRLATTLSPKSAVNWEILALLYRQISGVAENALVFSLDSYGKSILQDPLNPLLRLNVGGTYYAIKSYDLAIRFFTDSINLKPDFANGYYNLSVALRDKGDLNAALVAAQKVVELVDKNSSDYKIANDYLNDLKNKINPPTPATPPAAETTGALKEESLPKVVDVGNPPEKIATPAAVKKPDATPEPTPTP